MSATVGAQSHMVLFVSGPSRRVEHLAHPMRSCAPKNILKKHTADSAVVGARIDSKSICYGEQVIHGCSDNAYFDDHEDLALDICRFRRRPQEC